MTTIYVNDKKTDISNAILWARDQFGFENVTVISSFPGENWQFKFKNSKQATLFALKWT